MNEKAFAILFLFGMSYFLGISQNNVKIKAKVLDSKTKKAIPNVSIYIENQKKPVLTNSAGFFTVDKSKLQDNTVLFFSHLSYRNISLLVSDFKKDTLNIIYLKQNNFRIKEVTVLPDKGKRLILLSLNSIAENYPISPMILKCYFKEKITENDSVILEYEAIVAVYKPSYASNKADRIKFLQANIIKYNKKSRLWNYLYFIDSPYEILYADIAKHSRNFIQIPVVKTNFLREKHFKLFRYDVEENNVDYFVKFKPNPQKNKAVFEGEIIIEKKNYAIKKLEYRYAKSRMKRVNNNPSMTEVSLNKSGVYIPEKDYYSKISYQKYRNKYVLDEVKNMNSFEFQEGKDTAKIITVKTELKVLKIQDENVKKIRFWDKIPSGIKTIDILPKTDSVFWNNFHK